MVDTTTEWAAELRRRAAGLDQVIRAHDKRNRKPSGNRNSRIYQVHASDQKQPHELRPKYSCSRTS